MKTYFCTLALFIFSGAASLAQVGTRYAVASAPAKVTKEVSDSFAVKYSAVDNKDIKWRKTASGSFLALCRLEDLPSEVFFDATGKWLKTRTDYTVEQLPEKVKALIQARYDLALVKRAVKVELANIAPYFSVWVGEEGKELVVSEAGAVREY